MKNIFQKTKCNLKINPANAEVLLRKAYHLIRAEDHIFNSFLSYKR